MSNELEKLKEQRANLQFLLESNLVECTTRYMFERDLAQVERKIRQLERTAPPEW